VNIKPKLCKFSVYLRNHIHVVDGIRISTVKSCAQLYKAKQSGNV